MAEILLALAFVLSLWPRPHGRATRAYLAPVVGTLAATALGSVGAGLGSPWHGILSEAALVAFVFQPFFLLRLVAVLEPVGRRLLWAVGIGTGALVVLSSLSSGLPPALRVAAVALVVLFFLAVEGYATARLWRASRRSAGSARQRALILALASAAVTLFLTAVLALSLLHVKLVGSQLPGALSAVIALLYLAAAAPPAWLRHAWQMPVILGYYAASNALPAGDERAVLGLLVRTAMGATGAVAGGYATRAADRPEFHRVLGVGDALSLPLEGASYEVDEDDALERAWQTGRSQVATVEAAGRAPFLRNAALARRRIAVPVRAGGEVLGVLGLFTSVDWLFVRDDLALLEALAEHCGASVRAARTLAQEVAAAETLREANRALEAASTAKSDFLSGMSHELRTPLNAIIGFSDLLLQPQAGELTERQRRYAGNILESGQHLLQIVNDVLDIAKADAARLDVRPEAVRLDAVVQAALLLVRPQAETGGVALQEQVDPRAWLWADELRARQVIVNLLSNAVKFTPPGGRVSVRSGVRDGFVEVSVEDTGIGIAAEHLTGIFDEFTQVSHGTDRAYEGTGLGLPLVRRLAEAMGGGVRAESTPGEGSLFTVWFPAAAGPAGGTTAAAIAAVGATEAQVPVLVVDDDRMVRELCVQALGDAGYDVQAVPGLAAARESIAGRPPRLIVLDILLGEEYGDGLFEALASLRPRPRVVVASIVDPGRRQLPGPVDGWLVKPVRPDQLRAAVAQALAKPEREAVESGG